MINEILPKIYKIEVPLPNNPLKVLNSYIIKGRERNLIVDTGFNREECRNVLLSGLKELKINLSKTDLFITHMHADHSGLISSIASLKSLIYCSELDARIINFGRSKEYWEPMRIYSQQCGFPKEELKDVIEKHPGYKYCTQGPHNFRIIRNRDMVIIDDYKMLCIETPGHTQGHMCLYEPEKKFLFSGDHILDDITPNISLWGDDSNPLGEYLRSLDKVYELNVEIVFPGHRNFITNHRDRIKELKLHHQYRLNEINSILKDGPKTGIEIASKMKWNMSYNSFDLFPTPLKWFAIGETVAHLKYLEEKNLISKKLINNMFLFSLKA